MECAGPEVDPSSGLHLAISLDGRRTHYKDKMFSFNSIQLVQRRRGGEHIGTTNMGVGIQLWAQHTTSSSIRRVEVLGGAILSLDYRKLSELQWTYGTGLVMPS